MNKSFDVNLKYKANENNNKRCESKPLNKKGSYYSRDTSNPHKFVNKTTNGWGLTKTECGKSDPRWGKTSSLKIDSSNKEKSPEYMRECTPVMKP